MAGRRRFGDAISCDWLIIVSERFQQFADYRLVSRESRASGSARRSSPAFITASGGCDGGQLSGYRVSVNWETYQQFSEQFERSIVTQQIFEIDRDRATCAGGQATVDFMLAMIGRDTAPNSRTGSPTRSASACCARAKSVSAFRS
jgi:Transcriptional regulator containing an amidase domain and an AraC-type DNA-binding HTH domain